MSEYADCIQAIAQALRDQLPVVLAGRGLPQVIGDNAVIPHGEHREQPPLGDPEIWIDIASASPAGFSGTPAGGYTVDNMTVRLRLFSRPTGLIPEESFETWLYFLAAVRATCERYGGSEANAQPTFLSIRPEAAARRTEKGVWYEGTMTMTLPVQVQTYHLGDPATI